MNQRLHRSLALVLGSIALILVGGGTCWAQFGLPAAGNSISSSGQVVIKTFPDTMRMTIKIVEKGKSVDDAIEKLKDKTDAAKLRLEKFDATSVRVTAPEFAEEKSQQQRQMERMMVQRRRAEGRRVPKGLKNVPTVLISSDMTAEWSLDPKNQAKLLAHIHDLQEQIREADLAGTKEEGEKSAEDQEAAEEAQEMMGYMGDDQQPKPGEPQFSFVGRLNSERREKALTDAFRKARSQAERVARAIGGELGDLQSVGEGTNATGGMNAYNRFYGGNNNVMMNEEGSDEDQEDSAGAVSAISQKFAEVTFNVSINAQFGVKSR